MTKFYLFSILILSVVLLSFANVYYVPSGENIQSYIDTASDGDSVIVAPGTYNQNIEVMGKDIVLGSYFLTTGDTSYISQTVICGIEDAPTASLNSRLYWDIILKLTGFVITNSSDYQAPGIFINGQDIEVFKCEIIDCNGWGLVVFNSGGSAVIKNNLISCNSSGGISCTTDLLFSCCSIKDCEIVNNGNYGIDIILGGDYFEDPIEGYYISGNYICNNNTGIKIDAGICMAQRESLPKLIGHNTIIDNSHIGIMTNLSFAIDNNIIMRNGCGILLFPAGMFAAPSATLANNLILNNTGNGIEVGWGNLNKAEPKIINCTIAGNGCGLVGAYADVQLCNSLFWNNADNFDFANNDSTTITLSYCNADFAPSDSLIDGGGNLYIDPIFADAEGGDYSLTGESFLINRGMTDITEIDDFLPEIDLAGNPRIYQDRIDIGAYEYQYDVGINNHQSIKEKHTPTLSCHPNPFNPTTTIIFELSKAEEVTLSIYNVKGQLVRTLINNMDLEMGGHSVTWNGKNDAGLSVGSGVYYYKLKAGDVEQVEKMVLMK